MSLLSSCNGLTAGRMALARSSCLSSPACPLVRGVLPSLWGGHRGAVFPSLWSGQRSVNTVSPLTAAFNSKPSPYIHFSITRDKTGLFGLPELRTQQGFYLLKERALRETEALLAEGCSPDRARNMVEVFDELSNSLCRVADLSEFVRLAHPEANFRHAAQEAAFSVGALVEKLNVNLPLYQSLRRAVEEGDVMPTNQVDEHVAKLFLFDFEQCGIHLSEDTRNKVAHLNEAILALSQQFMANCQQPRRIDRDKLPAGLRHQFGLSGSSVLISGLMADSACEVTREAAYRLYQMPEPQQEYLLSQLLQHRHQMATLCGFPSFAHRTLGGSLAEQPELVQSFLDRVSVELRPLADEDYRDMADMKRRSNSLVAAGVRDGKALGVWDVAYFTGLAKHTVLTGGTGAKAPNLSHYFPLGAVMQGLDGLLRRLYGVTLDLCTPDPGELWADDVHKLAVSDEDGSLLGHIYCDFTERVGKTCQDCHFTIRGGKEMPDGSYQNPVVVVQLSLPSASWTAPPLLTPGMVENLFHEMGHALHSMLARTRYQHVTGTRCCTDFAEVPSILMEFFANDPRVVRTFARHYRTGEPMPEDLLAVMAKSKAVYAASELQTQVFYSALDQRYHSVDLPSGDTSTTDVLREEHDKHYGLPYVDNTAWQLRFSHFVGYGGKYYAYLVSRAVASWIWQTYFKEDPFSREAGSRYRNEVLRHGGGVPPRKLVGDFLAREVTPENLSEALISDLQHKRALAAS